MQLYGIAICGVVDRTMVCGDLEMVITYAERLIWDGRFESHEVAVVIRLDCEWWIYYQWDEVAFRAVHTMRPIES